jgi:hypothetical protein
MMSGQPLLHWHILPILPVEMVGQGHYLLPGMAHRCGVSLLIQAPWDAHLPRWLSLGFLWEPQMEQMAPRRVRRQCAVPCETQRLTLVVRCG